jgi:tRNA dimethylallyltransferase
VSADSAQVYRGMDIGTAKPTLAEREGIPHHMLDVVDPDEAFSVAQYKRLADTALEGIHGRGKIPIIAGGTGFYINALIYDTDFSGQEADDTHHRQQLARLAADRLYEMLKQADPEAAAAIHPNNKKRVIRALSYFQTTGERISRHNAAQKQKALKYDTTFIILHGDRERLYQRINRRADTMLQQGLITEVQGLLDKGYSPTLPGMQAIGYKEAVRHINGEWDLPFTLAAIKQATRNYAKRQLTWFKHQAKQGCWLDTDGQTAGQAAQTIAKRKDTQPSCFTNI